MRTLTLAFAAVGLLTSMTFNAAQEDVLAQMKWASGSSDWQTIEQTGSYVDEIHKELEHIRLPEGFKISLFAIAPDAGEMAVSPQGVAVFVGTRKSEVWVITDRNKDRIADEVMRFAPAMDFKSPTGVCFSKDGFLYIVEQNRVLIFPAAEVSYDYQSQPVAEIVPQGKLILPEEEDFNRTTRVCHVGPDNKLYISLGQPLNVPPREKADLYKQWGIGSIIRMDRDGRNREVFKDIEHMTHAVYPGMLFYTGTMFPEKYRGGFFSAQNNSLNGTQSVDARVMFSPISEDGNTGKTELFAEGWLQPTGEDIGRPVDIAQLHDGSILVSDDLAGAIYRISYGE